MTNLTAGIETWVEIYFTLKLYKNGRFVGTWNGNNITKKVEWWHKTAFLDINTKETKAYLHSEGYEIKVCEKEIKRNLVKSI